MIAPSGGPSGPFVAAPLDEIKVSSLYEEIPREGGWPGDCRRAHQFHTKQIGKDSVNGSFTDTSGLSKELHKLPAVPVRPSASQAFRPREQDEINGFARGEPRRLIDEAFMDDGCRVFRTCCPDFPMFRAIVLRLGPLY